MQNVVSLGYMLRVLLTMCANFPDNPRIPYHCHIKCDEARCRMSLYGKLNAIFLSAVHITSYVRHTVGWLHLGFTSL